MKLRRPFRGLVYVAVIIAAVGYMAFSAWRQASVVGNGTTVGRALGSYDLRLSGGGGLYYCRDGDAWKRCSGPPDSREVVSVDFDCRTHRPGFWHPLMEEQVDRLAFRSCLHHRPEIDRETRLRILEVIEEDFAEARIKRDFYAAGGGSTRRILWLGVLGDLSILAAFAAIIFSLVKLRREIRWRKPGHCAKCDYDLAGLTTGQCPECGAAIAHQVLPPAR